MITNELFNPRSIVVIGGSNDLEKPGGKILKNILDGGFPGKLYAVNQKETLVQGIPCFKSAQNLPPVDLAIIAIPARVVPETVEILAKEKGTKAFIVLSAGFSEFGAQGKMYEDRLVEVINEAGASLIGPNCIGIINKNYKGVFAGIVPNYSKNGCDIVASSGATIAFILEMAIPRGLRFSEIISVGNSAQVSVEDILAYWDETFDPKESSRVKLFYVEQIKKPGIFLKHCRSLIQKGCRIAGIKAGSTHAGSRAVSSHTGALAGSDMAVEALFRKAGITRCRSRADLVYVAGLFMHKPLEGKNLAVITHAGGSGVLLTDSLIHGGLNVPLIEGDPADELLGHLYPGSSVANPIDFLATGNADQLGTILEFVDRKFDHIDGSVVIFGTTGMFDVTGVYDVLHEKMKWCKKPIYPCLPSFMQAEKAVKHFLELGRIGFTDEVILGKAISSVAATPLPATEEEPVQIDREKIRDIVENCRKKELSGGFLPPSAVADLLDAAGIPRAEQKVIAAETLLHEAIEYLGFPLAMKVVGPVHKTEVQGVSLDIRTAESAVAEFRRLLAIEGATDVLVQKMAKGTEIFLGARKESEYGHLVVVGLGGIFVEIFRDIAVALSPVSTDEARTMIQSLRSYPILHGYRNREGVHEEMLADILRRLSALVEIAPEIAEIDINPMMGNKKTLVAVDCRIALTR